MGRFKKQITMTLLGAVLVVVVMNLALPVQARVEASQDATKLCVRHTLNGVVIGSCEDEGLIARLIRSSSFGSVETNFRDPIY